MKFLTTKRILKRLSSGVIALGFAALFCTQSMDAQTLNEEELKANYVLRFKDFVRWERSEHPTILIGVVGDFALQSVSDLVGERNAKTGQSKFEVVHITSLEQIKEVDILYFSVPFDDRWSDFLNEAREQGILTVGNGTQFLNAGCLITFEIRKNRVLFRLNYDAVEDYGIQFTSKLSKLALKG